MLLKTILTLAETGGFTVSEKRSCYLLERVVAERKAFLSYKKLVYRIKFRFSEELRQLEFSEVLKETSFGLMTGDSGTSFKKWESKTGVGPREGTIEEQSALFGKVYNYSFDFATFRKTFESAAKGEGYNFIWKYSL